MLHFLHWCYTSTALLSANQNRVIFACVFLIDKHTKGGSTLIVIINCLDCPRWAGGGGGGGGLGKFPKNTSGGGGAWEVVVRNFDKTS